MFLQSLVRLQRNHTQKTLRKFISYIAFYELYLIVRVLQTNNNKSRTYSSSWYNVNPLVNNIPRQTTCILKRSKTYLRNDIMTDFITYYF